MCLVFNAAMLRAVCRNRKQRIASYSTGTTYIRSYGTQFVPYQADMRHISLDIPLGLRYGVAADSGIGAFMTTASRRRALEQTGLLHPRPEAVTAPLFDGRESFFFALDKIQVKYEMLRSHVVDGLSATAAAEQHGYSRAAFYLITAAFAEAGMPGLLDEPRGRRGPLKLTPEMIEFVASADPTLSGAQLALEVEARFGVRLHRRTIERTRR